MRSALLAFVAALALSACTTAEQTADSGAPGQDCFRSDDIFGYGVIDDHSIDVRARGNHYIFRTAWNARELDWTHQVAIRSSTGWICTGNGLGVEIIGGDPPRHFPVSSIERMPEPPPSRGS